MSEADAQAAEEDEGRWQRLRDELLEYANDDAHTDEIAGLIAELLRPFNDQARHERYFRLFERNGMHVTPVHFYQPVPDTRTIRRGLWSSASQMPGVDLNETMQLHLLDEVFPAFREELAALPRTPTSRPQDFYLENEAFGGTDALAYYCIIRHFRPRLIVEVGAGYSTRLAAAAIERNGDGRIVCIEPYLPEVMRGAFDVPLTIVEQKVEEMDVSFFDQLESGDILFIDSSHVVRTGGDVTHLFLEVLPRLKPGVIVHVHDINFPFEVRRHWVMQQLRFWTEQYLLHAFLIGNADFEVLLCNSYLKYRHEDRLRRSFPDSNWWGGRSFWMRRKLDS